MSENIENIDDIQELETSEEVDKTPFSCSCKSCNFLAANPMFLGFVALILHFFVVDYAK